MVASVFTPYQLLFLERIWPLLGARPLMLVDTRPTHIRAQRPPRLPADRVLALDIDGSVTSPTQAAMAREAWHAIRDFLGARDFVFVHGSLQWPLNNIVYTRARRQRGFRMLQIDDGLSTYLDLLPSLRELVRNLAREAIAAVRGFPRRTPIVGHPLGHDVADLAAILVGIAPTPAARRQRPFTVVALDGSGVTRHDRASVMFVGQPYAAHLGLDRIHTLARYAYGDLVGRGFARIAFKPHHFQPASEVAVYAEAGFEPFDPPATVEEVVESGAFATIASINSTALLTVKALFGDDVAAISYGGADFAPRHERRDRAEVARLFAQAGVEMVPSG